MGRVRNLAIAVAALLFGAAAPALAQSGATLPGVQTTLGINGDPDMGPNNEYPGMGVFKPGATLALSVYFYLDGTSTTTRTLTFADPNDAIDFWIADATGSYVAWIPGATRSSQLAVTYAQGAEIDAQWDQTDWYGTPLPKGIYTIEATINASPARDIGPTFFQIGRQPDAPASSFAATIRASATTVRPGMWIGARLTVFNLTGVTQILRFPEPWLPRRLTFIVRDSSGRDIWQWSAPVPMMAIRGPSFAYIAGGDQLDFGPVAWPSVDDQGRPLPAGTYKLVMKLNNSTPAGTEHVKTVRLAGTPAPVGNIQLPQGVDTTPVRVGGSATSPQIGTVWNGAPLAILYEGNYWDQVQTTNSTNGEMITGWVRKTAVVKR